MTVAWIAWRSPDKVREFWDPYRSKCLDWHFKEWRVGPDGPVHAGHFLEERRPATLSLLSFVERYDSSHGLLPSGAISIDDAKVKLWDALSENAFQATGISTDTGERTVIPDCVWPDLMDIEEHGRDALRVREPWGAPSRRGYNDIALKRQNIMAIWHPHRLEECGHKLPALIEPEGPGYMPLYFAAQWIATCGGTVEIDPDDLSVWQDAFAQLLARIASEDVAITGVRDGEREKLNGHMFAGISVDYPFSDTPFSLLVSDELYLSSCVYIDEEHWRKGWNDSLQTPRGCKWSKLMVLKSDVAHHWPHSLVQSPTGTGLYRSGGPGKPSAMHLVRAEHRARWERREAAESVREGSRSLSRWLHDVHPTAPPLTPKAIENRIRDEHRSQLTRARN